MTGAALYISCHVVDGQTSAATGIKCHTYLYKTLARAVGGSPPSAPPAVQSLFVLFVLTINTKTPPLRCRRDGDARAAERAA